MKLPKFTTHEHFGSLLGGGLGVHIVTPDSQLESERAIAAEIAKRCNAYEELVSQVKLLMGQNYHSERSFAENLLKELGETP